MGCRFAADKLPAQLLLVLLNHQRQRPLLIARSVFARAVGSAGVPAGGGRLIDARSEPDGEGRVVVAEGSGTTEC